MHRDGRGKYSQRALAPAVRRGRVGETDQATEVEAGRDGLQLSSGRLILSNLGQRHGA
jgi:hypothetical protein